jgi:hypothetical protein
MAPTVLPPLVPLSQLGLPPDNSIPRAQSARANRSCVSVEPTLACCRGAGGSNLPRVRIRCEYCEVRVSTRISRSSPPNRIPVRRITRHQATQSRLVRHSAQSTAGPASDGRMSPLEVVGEILVVDDSNSRLNPSASPSIVAWPRSSTTETSPTAVTRRPVTGRTHGRR